jgi:hypothetical protein
MEDEPLHHIERSRLPWHDERKTECGLDPGKVPTWSRDEAIAQARKLGRQRFSLFCCMTCTNTVERHSTWDKDPASCMVRFAERNTLRWSRYEENATATRFAAELRAIAALIEAHRPEFDETVEGLLNTASLDDARRTKRAAEKWKKRTGLT